MLKNKLIVTLYRVSPNTKVRSTFSPHVYRVNRMRNKVALIPRISQISNRRYEILSTDDATDEETELSRPLTSKFDTILPDKNGLRSWKC